MGEIGGYDLPFFSKDKFLTKTHIISQFNNDIELAQYLPDRINPSKVTRSFPLALLFNVKKEKYLNLYGLYKQKKETSTTGGKHYNVSITQSLLLFIENYSPSTN